MRIAACLAVVLSLLVVDDVAARIRAPDGVSVRVVARDIPNPTNVAFDSRGRMWVTSAGNTPNASDGVWLAPRRGRPRHVIRGLFPALGLCWRRGELYVSHGGTVTAYRGGRSRTVVSGLRVGLHSTDSIVPGPGGRLYLGQGSTENASGSGRVVSFLPDGDALRTEATGLRNPYGLAFIPGTDKLLVSENGRDDLGLRRPPDELNLVDVSRKAPHLGFPSGVGRPFVSLAPHAAAGAVAVARDWAGRGPTAFVTEYGSSFRGNQTGSDVIAVRLRKRGGRWTPARVFRFASGFARRGPLGAAVGPDRALYVTLWDSGRVVRFAARRPRGAVFTARRTSAFAPLGGLLRALSSLGEAAAGAIPGMARLSPESD